MVGLKTRRLGRASIAGLLALTGCVDRAFDFGDSGGIGPDPDPNPDPTSDPNPDPTTDPNPDPTGDPVPPPPDNPGPPQLLDVRYVDNFTLTLTFSEGLASTAAVDPRQFRLSAAFGAAKAQEYGIYGTFYQEVGQWITNPECQYCYEYCDNYYGGTDGYYGSGGYYYCPKYCQTEYCYGSNAPLNILEIVQIPERPDTLWLTFDRGITPQVCENVNSAPPGLVVGLFLHYFASGAAPITDNSGELLASIAEHWVLTDPQLGNTYLDGFFPEMNPMLPIPCEF